MYSKTIYTHAHTGAFRDCEDAYRQGRRENGVYDLLPDNDGLAFKAYCEMTTDGGGWTVIQRRLDGSVTFQRDWINYVRGFGNLKHEFFLGLEKIYRLSKSYNSQLRVNLTDWEGARAYAKYSTFGIGSSQTYYTLTVSGYFGTAGDSMGVHNGMRFTTTDVDNDKNPALNCAVASHGAWWYNSCHKSNLNGEYLGGATTSSGDGVIWLDYRGNRYSLKSSIMMIRRS